MTEREIEARTILWSLLTETLDYQDKKWYVNEDGKWNVISFGILGEFLTNLGIELQDHERIIRLFNYRNQEAHRRDHDEIKEAQLRFGL